MEILDDGGGVRIAYAGGVFMSFFYGTPTLARMEFLFANEQRWVQAVPRFSAISIVDPRAGKEMPGEAREKAKEITEAFKDSMAASCTVVYGTGFFPALVRSILAGIQLLSSRKVAWNVASSTDEALVFVQAIHAKEGIPLDVDAVRAALAAVMVVEPARRAV